MQQLYRHFAKDGTLLYVGISISVFSRLIQHKHQSYWFNDIQKITVENFQTRKEVLLAENSAIKNEKPLYNIRGSRRIFIAQPSTGVVMGELLELPASEQLLNCMVAWTPPDAEDMKGNPLPTVGAVRIGPHPDTIGWSDPFLCTDGACWDHWRKVNKEKRVQLLLNIFIAMVRDRIDPKVIHQAFMWLPEYNSIDAKVEMIRAVRSRRVKGVIA
jgi:hypothetical protein